MHPDEELNLKAAFTELHRKQREQAPSFEAMRERAMHQASDRQRFRQHLPVAWRIVWTAAAVVVMATGMWRIGQSPKSAQLNSTERVDELITAIEQHLERNEPSAFSEYPTDLLLADNQGNFPE